MFHLILYLLEFLDAFVYCIPLYNIIIASIDLFFTISSTKLRKHIKGSEFRLSKNCCIYLTLSWVTHTAYFMFAY